MKSIRIGKDIRVRWSVLTNKEALSFEGRDLKLQCHTPFHTTEEVEFTRSGNVLEFVVPGIGQSRVGKYSFTLWENFGKEGQTAVDCCDAFCLVRTTCDEGGSDDSNLATESVNLETSNLELLTTGSLPQVKSEQFCIHTKKSNVSPVKEATVGPYDFYTVIEGVADEDLPLLADSGTYRLVLMQERKHAGEGRRWRIPMLPYVQAEPTGRDVHSTIAETDTWWPVTGRIVPWFRDGRKLNQVLPLTISPTKKRFAATRNIKHRIGVALFRKTGFGGEGWTRISNIAHIELIVVKRASPEPVIRVAVIS